MNLGRKLPALRHGSVQGWIVWYRESGKEESGNEYTAVIRFKVEKKNGVKGALQCPCQKSQKGCTVNKGPTRILLLLNVVLQVCGDFSER